MQPQGESIWGNINLCIEIALDIYFMIGENGEGIVVPKERAEEVFSEKTVEAGKEADGCLYYPKGDTMEMPLYEMMKKRVKSSSMYKKKKRDYIFGGFLRCGECGCSVTGVARVRSNREGYIPKKLYECVSYRKYGKSRCGCHNVREDLLLANFKNFLILLRDNYISEINNLKLEEYKSNKKKNAEEQKLNLKNLEAEYKILVSQRIKEIASSSEDKREFIENTYKNLEEEKYKEIEKTKINLAELQNEDLEIKQEKLKQTIDYFNQIIENDEPDKSILNMLIDKIYIYHDKSVKFELKIGIEKILSAKKN